MFIWAPFLLPVQIFCRMSLYMCKRQSCLAKGNNFPPICTHYSSGGFLRLLSIPKEAFWVYSVYLRRFSACTQYEIGDFLCILNIVQEDCCDCDNFVVYWVYTESLLFHTESTRYTEGWCMQVLSMRQNSFPESFLVYKHRAFYLILSILSILSIPGEASCEYSLLKWRPPAYNQYEIEGLLLILSIHIKIATPLPIGPIEIFVFPGWPSD